jgi:hypothetical protein
MAQPFHPIVRAPQYNSPRILIDHIQVNGQMIAWQGRP